MSETYHKTITRNKKARHNYYVNEEYEAGIKLLGSEPERARKLLLHKRELERLKAKVDQDGRTLIPLELYFNAENRVKVKLGVCEGKKQHDKRQDLKKREHNREIERERARRDNYRDY